MTPTEKKLIELYQKMHELTAPVCAGGKKNKSGYSDGCGVPHGCCHPDYCKLAEQWAKEIWNIKLEPACTPPLRGLKFMGEKGCIVAPHLRPICTLHVCCINSIGFRPKDPAWTKLYFSLRDQIDKLEYERGTP